ncbi:MFS transporter [Streptomyces sp. NPDC002308]
MTGLGLVWLIHAETGSFGAAGLVAGSFALAEALVGPQVARLMDRYGQTRVLVPLLTAHAAAVAVLVASALTGAPTAAAMAAGLAAGATIPQVGALSSARWSALLRGRAAEPADAALAPAFALEAFANEAAYLLGPALAVLAATRLHPAAGTVLAGGLVVGAGLVFASLRGTAPEPAARPVRERPGGRGPRRPWGPRRPPESRRPQGPRVLWGRGFVALLVVNLALGVFFGSTQVSVSAVAADLHAAPAAGLLYGLMGVASLLAGLAYGTYTRRTPPATQLPLLLAFLAGASLLPLLADTP